MTDEISFKELERVYEETGKKMSETAARLGCSRQNVHKRLTQPKNGVRKKGGRPSNLTDMTDDAVIAAVISADTLTKAAAAIGVSMRSLRIRLDAMEYQYERKPRLTREILTHRMTILAEESGDRGKAAVALGLTPEAVRYSQRRADEMEIYVPPKQSMPSLE